ncbi:hypothetical protein F5X71_33195 [Nocardia brasiliensis]|uniref:Uncharacterized protein n=1 Tax=Nocardia brasiliensis TaxID=37326 RepID=A0A6G9Y015_NOCBR|nr:hypothetical protein [Nocardia brasiliensis]QIS06514.1 hypothetical protein F5X71_33195 [Nocardia brasiliensis]
MSITATAWLITSDVVHEAAFRIDLPEADRGTWVLSYLPTKRRLSRDQAMTGMALAEMIVLDGSPSGGPRATEIAELHAAELGMTLHDVMSLLALRAQADPEPAPTTPPGDRHRSAAALAHGATSFAA